MRQNKEEILKMIYLRFRFGIQTIVCHILLRIRNDLFFLSTVQAIFREILLMEKIQDNGVPMNFLMMHCSFDSAFRKDCQPAFRSRFAVYRRFFNEKKKRTNEIAIDHDGGAEQSVGKGRPIEIHLFDSIPT